jgi:pimeloyl-ACP methyl ester carboxylesterase
MVMIAAEAYKRVGPNTERTASLGSTTSAGIAYRTVRLDGHDIFYREAGPEGAPVLLLLHGFSTSSSVLRILIPAFADEFHLIAPVLPGFAAPVAGTPPNVADFEYTFAHLTEVLNRFTEKLELTSYALYAQGDGVPVCLRLATRYPHRVQALIVQNGDTCNDGNDGNGCNDSNGGGVLSVVERIKHVYFQKHQPSTLLLWGKHEDLFCLADADPDKKGLRNPAHLEYHLLHTGCFSLEDDGLGMVGLMRNFLRRTATP